jgi:magnesium transporter
VAALESEIFEDDSGQTATMQDILALRRELVLFRRVVGPERDMLGDVLRRDLPFINPELIPYFIDVRDHAMRIAEELDVLRDLLAASLEGQLSLASNQLNTTVRMMTAWSIILMSMTVVAGVYGMNFNHMPELAWRYGYLFAVTLMLGIGGLLFTFFKRKDWL